MGQPAASRARGRSTLEVCLTFGPIDAQLHAIRLTEKPRNGDRIPTTVAVPRPTLVLPDA